MNSLMASWYLYLSQFSAWLSAPVNTLAGQVNLPLASALLFGLLGSTAPCQLTTNLSALAYVSRHASKSGQPMRTAAAYVLGKILVYTVVGGLAVSLGLSLNQIAVPVVVAVRKGLGPLLILIGLGFLGVFRLRGGGGAALSAQLRNHLSQQGTWGAFLMGVAFSVAFCPTLFWLFFGLTIPLGLRSPWGWTFPGVFAVGTALPLLAFSALLGAGLGMAETGLVRMKGVGKVLNRVAGAVFVLAGINDTLTYWAL